MAPKPISIIAQVPGSGTGASTCEVPVDKSFRVTAKFAALKFTSSVRHMPVGKRVHGELGD
jgi:hypothetical protein